ncbi:MAG TPA: TldD/PmbA family protein [Geobacteraceae bacterium]|nr:TldD/PmbA family protein [Geobacteraceae bacterium]
MNLKELAGRIEKIISGRSVDGFEISAGASRNLSLEVKERKIDSFKCSSPVGVSVRILKSQGMGFSYSTSMSDADLERMIDAALVAAENQTPDPWHGFSAPSPFPFVGGLFDEGLAAIDEQEKVRQAMELERLTLAADARVKRVRKASYGESEYEVYIRNSEGVEGGFRGTSVSASVSVVAEEGDDSQMGWDFGFGTHFSDLRVDEIAATAASRALALLGARKIATLRCPVVLDNQVASDILEVLAPSFLAENVLKGKSMLAGRMGKKVFSPCLRIRDNGLLPGGMATAPFDAEGVPQQDTLLVDDGVLGKFLYDGYWARRDGAVSTGNSTRGGVKSPPHLGISNFYIENGSIPAADLVRGIDKGVFITDVMGMHTANPISGDFSVGASGFYVENGVIAYPVKEIALSGNIIDLFGSVEMIGNDLRFFGEVGSPSLRIAALDVSGE